MTKTVTTTTTNNWLLFKDFRERYDLGWEPSARHVHHAWIASDLSTSLFSCCRCLSLFSCCRVCCLSLFSCVAVCRSLVKTIRNKIAVCRCLVVVVETTVNKIAVWLLFDCCCVETTANKIAACYCFVVVWLLVAFLIVCYNQSCLTTLFVGLLSDACSRWVLFVISCVRDCCLSSRLLVITSDCW